MATQPATRPQRGDQLQAQAAALRRAGKSIREIKLILGVSSDRVTGEALRGAPPPGWTRRPRAKDDLHARARELRTAGRSYDEIAAELGVSKSSVSLWVRDMPRTGRFSAEARRQRGTENLARWWAEEKPVREARRQAVRRHAMAQIGVLTDREVLIAGAVAYWCEGTKNKPYARAHNRVVFVNSDPDLILLFLRFLAVAGIERDRIICQLQIHESADVAAAQRYWLDATDLAPGQFRRPWLKRHNPKTTRKNTGEHYHGCLRLEAHLSADLYRRIEGWATGIFAAGDADVP